MTDPQPNDQFLSRRQARSKLAGDRRAILDEVRRHVSVSPDAIERRIAFMNAAFEDALVAGYESLIDQMRNDPKDRHVLAAAVVVGADSIITGKLRDLPLAAGEPTGWSPNIPTWFCSTCGPVSREHCCESLASRRPAPVAEVCG